MNILNKITMKSIGAQPSPWSVTERKALVHIFGECESFKTGSTTYGLFEKFEGKFEAVNLETGEGFAARALLCPPIMEALIKEALENAGAEAGKVGNAGAREKDIEGKHADTPVLFAFEVGVLPKEKKEGQREAGQGYEYTVRPLMPSKRSDALEELRKLSETHRPTALPAPAAPKEPAAPAAASTTSDAHKAAAPGQKHVGGSRRR